MAGDTAVCNLINPYVTNGFSHPYHLDEPTLMFRDIRPSGLSYLELYCLPMSQKWGARFMDLGSDYFSS